MSDVVHDLLAQLHGVVRDRLESLLRSGVSAIPKSTSSDAWLPELLAAGPAKASSVDDAPPTKPRYDLQPTRPSPSPPVASPRPITTPSPSEPSSPMPRRSASVLPPLPDPLPKTIADRTAALEAVRCVVADCTRCPILAKTRTQTVFGVGNVKPRVAFFGEAPGADEDRVGEPFVGRAGQLLTKIIEACTFKREDVYIFNTVKCRPPENRNPSDEEVENCRGYFERQIELLRPEYIVCVGTVPTKALLRTTKSIGQMRGSFHDYHGIKVLATYHPAYLLRNPDAKKYVWDDMKLLLADMGIALPSK